MTAAAETKPAAPTRDILADVPVDKPEARRETTRKYLCFIKPVEGLEHLDLQIRVGPACFAKHTHVWEGKGTDAKLVELRGSICVLTDEQVQEIRDKVRHRYYRKVVNKGVVVGIADVDGSDSGGVVVDQKTGEHNRRPPAKVPGRLAPGDLPIRDLLGMDVCFEDTQVRGRVITLDEARRVLEQAEGEASRPLEDPAAPFTPEEAEKGRGGKRVPNAKADQLARDQAMRDLADGKSAIRGPGGQATGAGRIPEGK